MCAFVTGVLTCALPICQLQLRIELARARIGQASGELDDATATLGNAALRLQWLQLAMQRMLAARQPARALAAYKEAADLLRNGDCLSDIGRAAGRERRCQDV